MPQAQVPFYALNAGEVDPNALARIDLEKLRVAGETMVNFTPTVLGGMHMRPGTKYLGSTRNDAEAVFIPYVFNTTTTSLIEVTSGAIRVRNNDALVTYANYSTAITNANFASGIGTGWQNASSTGASVSASSNWLSLFSTKYTYARVRQTVSVSNTSTLHCIKIVVARGPIVFRVGTSAGGDEVVSSQSLGTGTHFLAFTPNASTIYVEIEANSELGANRHVTSCDFVKNQILELPGPWATADLHNIRYAQSGSIVFVACRGYQQYKIERRGPNSWSLTDYLSTAGPYLAYDGSRVRLRATDTVGTVQLSSDRPFFKPGMVGSVFEITTDRQTRKEVFTGSRQSTGWVKVTGAGASRNVSYSLSYGGGSSGTVFLQWSFGTPDNWSRATGLNITSSGSSTGTFFASDGTLENSPYRTNDNNVVYYRLSTIDSNVTGTITASITRENGGGQVGAVRVLSYINSTTVWVEVLKELGAANAWTDDWREGAWSAHQSWPSAVAFYDGRLWWGGLDKVYGSVSDDYYNFDPTVEGDSGPIVRSIATGPVETIGWLLPLQRLIVGTASSEVSIRSSSFDEPLTPSQFTARNASTIGSAPIQAMTVDSVGVYIQKNLSKVYEFVYDININDYSSKDLTRLNKNICKPGVVSVAVQRQPDTRVWFVKSDGTMAMLVYERDDEVVGWARYEMDGFIEDVCVLPSENDDIVYLTVRRTINGQTRRYIEKMGVSSETEEGDGSWLVDSAVRFTTGGAPTTTISGLGHLAGRQVIAKGASADPEKRFTVSAGGQIFIDIPVTSIVVGLPYEARFKTVKLAYGSAAGTALTQKKRVDHLGVVANRTAPDGVRIGRDFDSMTRLSSLLRGKTMVAGEILDQFDYDMTSFGGMWDSDSRVCIRGVSPYPAHIIGLVIKMNTNDKQFTWPRKPASAGDDQEG